MPIRRLLAGGDLTPEEQQILVLAFERTLRKLGLVDRNDPVCEMVARKVIEIGRNGPKNAVGISEIAVREFQRQ